MNGSLQKKGNIWYAVIELGDRKQKWISTKCKNKNEAKIVLRDILNKMENNSYIDPANITFSDFLVDWLNTIKNQVAKTTWEGYEIIMDVHVIPYFKEKNILLQKLQPIHIQQYYNFKLQSGRADGKGGLSANTIKKHHINIKCALDYAVKMNLIASNPADKVTPPKVEKFVGNYYTVEQIEKLLQIVKGTLIETPVFLTAHYGFRRGEVLGLRWSDINFEERTITVRNTRVRFNSEIYEKPPKTESSRRTLPLIDSVAEYLIKLKKEYEENKVACGKSFCNDGYICCWANGKPLDLTYVNHKFKELLKKYDMPHIRFHDLRHSTASYLLKLGFSLKEIQEWLGHSSISTTANIYTHIDIEMKKNIASKINNLFK